MAAINIGLRASLLMHESEVLVSFFQAQAADTEAFKALRDRFRRFRVRPFIPRLALALPSESPLDRLLRQRDSRAFIDVFGLDVQAFDTLCSYLRPALKVRAAVRPKRGRGRPALLSVELKVAITLHWLVAHPIYKSLALISGAGLSCISRCIREVIPAIGDVLESTAEGKIEWPSARGMEAYASLVNQRTSHLKHAFGFVDGVKFNVHAPTNADEQVAFYNGWKCGCFVSAILVFAPDGTMIYANYNCPGPRHDAFNAQELFSILLDDDLTPRPYFIVGDSAFPRRECMEGRILTSPSASDLPSYFPSFAQASAAYLV
jgi:hypothetical protein